MVIGLYRISACTNFDFVEVATLGRACKQSLPSLTRNFDFVDLKVHLSTFIFHLSTNK